MVQRYFINEKYDGQKMVTITGEDVHHIGRVMRMEKGDTFLVVFTNAITALVQIEHLTSSTVEVSIQKLEEEKRELPVHVTIVSGLPKGDKLEWIIQKGTELGANQFVPFLAERSIVKWNENKGDKKLARWQKIAKEAAEQSHRQQVPTILSPMNISELIQFSQSFDWKILAYEEAATEGKSKIANVLQSINHNERLMVVFGPEGGISEEEKNLFVQNQFIICGLGPRILRTETAPLYALSAISYQLELLR